MSAGGNAARIFTALIGYLCVGLTMAACLPDDSAPDHVTVAVLPYLTLTPFHIAQAEGYFAEENLEVEFVRLVSVQDVMFLLASGDVDATAGWVGSALLNAIAQGNRVRLVATLGELDPDACPFNAFVARRELLESGALEDPERLRELTFDLDVLLPQGYWADAVLAPYGVTIDELEVVSVPPPAAVDALREGTIDVTNASEPFIDRFRTQGDADIWKVTAERLPGYSDSAVMFGASLLDERSDVGERFAVALLRAMRQFQLGKTPRNLALVAEFTDLSPERAAAICWPAVPEDPSVNLEGLRGYQRWAVDHGISERVLADDELVDHRFVVVAVEALRQ